MNRVKLGITLTVLMLFSACGADSEEASLTEEREQSQQGVLSNPQQQALDAARSVEQTLLDSAADREKELEARLRGQ